MFAVGCGRAPDLVGGETGRVVRIQDGDALVLDTGLRVRLAEVEAPAIGFAERAGQPFAEEASALLSAAALGRMVKLYYGGLSRDRYERAIAHVIASDETGGDVWLNGMVVRQGGARVRSFPDNMRRVRRLYALEAEAREAQRGLWADDAYRVQTADGLSGVSGFVIVEGRLRSVAENSGQTRAVFDGDGVMLETDATLGAHDAPLKLEPGVSVRVRGWLPARSDPPAMRLTHWGQIETL